MSIGSFASGMADGIKTGAYLRAVQDERETNKIDREFKQEKLREQREAAKIIKDLQRDLLGGGGSDADTSNSNPVRSGVTVTPSRESAPASGTSSPTTAPTSAPAGTGATDSGIVTSLLRTESGGDYQAKNDSVGAGGQRGHYGRLQFGHARLSEASRALGEEITPERFLNDPALQQRVEQWHLNDIDAFVKDQGLDRYIGQEINGTPMTQDSLRAIAHLGGKAGMKQYLESGGQYNPKDVNGTHLSDYAKTHAGSAATPASSGLTAANTKPVPTLSAEQYADIYQRYTLLAASNPTAAERLKPTLESVRNLGLSRYMEQYEGDRGSLDYMRYYGQGQALFGQPMDPTLLFNAERMAKADERSDRAEQRAERADQRAEEAHKATMDEHELNRRLKEAEVTLKQYEPLYKLIRGDQFEAAQRLASVMGFKISGFEDGTVRLPDGTEVPTTYYWRTTEDGQQVRENTAEQARRMGFVETNLSRMKVQTLKGGYSGEPDKLVGVTVGADGQPVAREIQVQPASSSDREAAIPTAGSDRAAVATGIGAKTEAAPKEPEGNWFTRMFKSDDPESASAAERGQAAPVESKPETDRAAEAAPQAAFVKDAPTFADPERGVMQEQDGKTVLVYPNGTRLKQNGQVTHVVVNGEVVPVRQETEGS